MQSKFSKEITERKENCGKTYKQMMIEVYKITGPNIMTNQVKVVINTLRVGKTPRSDGIYSEFFTLPPVLLKIVGQNKARKDDGAFEKHEDG